MMQVRRLTLRAMMVLFVASAYGSNECTMDKVISCVEMTISLDNGTDAIEQATAECRNFDKFEVCLEPIKHHCKPAQKLFIQMMEKGYNFFCQKRNFDEFRKHADCVSESRLEAEILNHTNDFSIDMERAAGSETRICKITKGYLDNVVNSVYSSCGFTAARYMRSWYWHFLKPLLNLIRCPMPDFLPRETVDFAHYK